MMKRYYAMSAVIHLLVLLASMSIAPEVEEELEAPRVQLVQLPGAEAASAPSSEAAAMRREIEQLDDEAREANVDRAKNEAEARERENPDAEAPDAAPKETELERAERQELADSEHEETATPEVDAPDTEDPKFKEQLNEKQETETADAARPQDTKVEAVENELEAQRKALEAAAAAETEAKKLELEKTERPAPQADIESPADTKPPIAPEAPEAPALEEQRAEEKRETAEPEAAPSAREVELERALAAAAAKELAQPVTPEELAAATALDATPVTRDEAPEAERITPQGPNVDARPTEDVAFNDVKAPEQKQAAESGDTGGEAKATDVAGLATWDKSKGKGAKDELPDARAVELEARRLATATGVTNAARAGLREVTLNDSNAAGSATTPAAETLPEVGMEAVAGKQAQESGGLGERAIKAVRLERAATAQSAGQREGVSANAAASPSDVSRGTVAVKTESAAARADLSGGAPAAADAPTAAPAPTGDVAGPAPTVTEKRAAEGAPGGNDAAAERAVNVARTSAGAPGAARKAVAKATTGPRETSRGTIDVKTESAAARADLRNGAPAAADAPTAAPAPTGEVAGPAPTVAEKRAAEGAPGGNDAAAEREVSLNRTFAGAPGAAEKIIASASPAATAGTGVVAPRRIDVGAERRGARAELRKDAAGVAANDSRAAPALESGPAAKAAAVRVKQAAEAKGAGDGDGVAKRVGLERAAPSAGKGEGATKQAVAAGGVNAVAPRALGVERAAAGARADIAKGVEKADIASAGGLVAGDAAAPAADAGGVAEKRAAEAKPGVGEDGPDALNVARAETDSGGGVKSRPTQDAPGLGAPVEGGPRRTALPDIVEGDAKAALVGSADDISAELVGLGHRVSAGRITIGLAQYAGDWDCDKTAMPNLAYQFRERIGHSVEAETKQVSLASADVFQCPFIFLSGHQALRFSSTERLRLQQYLLAGGALWINDSTHEGEESFDRSARAEIARLTAGAKLEPIPMDDPLFKACYDLSRGYKGYRVPPGDKYREDRLHGIRMGGRWVVVYTRNDYGDGLEIDPHTHPLMKSLTNLSPREMQEGSVRMGMNLLFYFLRSSKHSSQMDQLQLTDMQQAVVVLPSVEEAVQKELARSKASPLFDTLKPAGPWARLESWSPDKTEVRIGEKDGRVAVTLTRGAEGKNVIGVDTQGDLTAQRWLAFSLDSRMTAGLRVALGLSVGEGHVYYESAPYYVKPGANPAVAFELTAATFKSEATKWEYTTKVQDLDDVRAVQILFYPIASGALELDAFRLAQ